MTDKDDEKVIKAAAKRVADRIKAEDDVAARDQEGKESLMRRADAFAAISKIKHKFSGRIGDSNA